MYSVFLPGKRYSMRQMDEMPVCHCRGLVLQIVLVHLKDRKSVLFLKAVAESDYWAIQFSVKCLTFYGI